MPLLAAIPPRRVTEGSALCLGPTVVSRTWPRAVETGCRVHTPVPNLRCWRWRCWRRLRPCARRRVVPNTADEVIEGTVVARGLAHLGIALDCVEAAPLASAEQPLVAVGPARDHTRVANFRVGWRERKELDLKVAERQDSLR